MTRSVSEILNFVKMIAAKLPSTGRAWVLLVFIGSFLALFGELCIALGLQVLLQYLGTVADLNSSYLNIASRYLTQYQILVVLFVFGSVVRFLSGFLVQYGAVVLREMGQEVLRNRAFEILLYSNPLTNSKIKSEMIVSNYAEVFPRASGALLNLMSAIASGVQVVFLGLSLVYVSPAAAGIGLLVTFGIGFLVIKLNALVRFHAKKSPQISQLIFKHLERISRSFLFIMVARLELKEELALSREASSLRQTVQRSYLYATIASLIPALLGTLSIVVIIIFSREVIRTSADTLVLFVYMYTRFSQGLGALSNQLGYLNGAVPHITACLEFNELVPEQLNKRNRTSDFLLHIEMPPEINVSKLFFEWPGGGRTPLVDGLSFQVRGGETLIIEGPSGSGKSTLLLLILGILSPKAGQILLEGDSPEHFFKNNYHKVAYAGPNPFMINGSILENLTYGLDTEVSEDFIWEVLDILSLAEVIKSKPSGLQAEFNLLSPNLSTGQQQRLALARALIRKPLLLILDEVTANLDLETEAEIVKSLADYRYPSTKIIVSHREAMSRIGNQRIRLEGVK